MGLAVDTIGFSVTNQAALTAVTLAAGDTLTVRNFPEATAKAFLYRVTIQSVKSIEVDATTNIIGSGWLDTAINATEDVLHANTDYAILGYDTETACTAVAFKGIDTG